MGEKEGKSCTVLIEHQGMMCSCRGCTHLAAPALHHDLGHVNDVSHCFYVLSFPALDGFGKDLQLKLFPLPQLLAL